jgi:hypothetical protein
MVITREIKIKINESNYSYYENLGYDISIGETIKIPIELMSRGSHYKIKCKCDGCGVEKDVIFKNYIKYNNKWGEYFCRKCSEKKRKETLRKNYGVDYPIQNELIYFKIKNTLINKYGVDNISKIDTKTKKSV